MRLIDADAFDTKLFNDGFFGGLAAAIGNTPRKRKFTIGEFRGMLKNAPTVDAVPVVHGKWIHNWDESDVGYNTYQCDNCGLNYMVDWEFEKPKYCPNCGAKMDLED